MMTLATLSCCLSLPAFASETFEVLKYKLVIDNGVVSAHLCQLVGIKPFFECANTGLKQVKTAFSEMDKLVKKRPAKAALKEHLVAVVMQINGMEVTGGERVIAYDARQATLKGRADEAWIRFEMEN